MIDSLEAHAPPSTIATQPDSMPGQAVSAFASASSATVYHDTGTPICVDSSPRFDEDDANRCVISSAASNASFSPVISGAPPYADSTAAPGVMCHHLTNHLHELSLTFVRINLFVFNNEFAQAEVYCSGKSDIPSAL